MPRGTRSVPAGELHEGVHHRPSPEFTFVSPDVDVLSVTCWCERAVVDVPQWMVRVLGATLSCGRPRCRPPGVDPFLVSVGDHRAQTAHCGLVRRSITTIIRRSAR